MLRPKFTGGLVGKQDLAIAGSSGDVWHGVLPDRDLAIIVAVCAQETSNCFLLCVAPTLFAARASDNGNIAAKPPRSRSVLRRCQNLPNFKSTEFMG
jgi:hypothetical protein